MMPNYLVTAEDLVAIANAIRAKTGGSGQLVFPNGFISGIGVLVYTADATNIVRFDLYGNLSGNFFTAGLA